jgi:hypothetical protein
MNNSQYAIPGFMTPPTAPKSSNRLQTDYDGTIRAVVHSSSTGSEPVHVRIVKLVPGNKFDVLVDDPLGVTLFRQRDPYSGVVDRWDYLWYYDALSPRLPYGDLQLWVDAPKRPRMIYSLFVPKLELTTQPALETATEDNPQSIMESQWGTAEVPVDTATLTIPFNEMFSVVPTLVLVSLSAPLGAETVEVVATTVAGYNQSELTVALSSPLSISGYRLSWYARIAQAQTQSDNNQSGQTLVPIGEVTLTIPFRTQAPGIPAVFGTVQAASDYQDLGVLSFVITNVTVDGFTVVFSSPQDIPMLFNWEMHA